MEYDVKFEVFDKKLMVKVNAASEIDALEYVKAAIKVHSIVPTSKQSNTSSKNTTIRDGDTIKNNWQNYFNDFFGGLNKKK